MVRLYWPIEWATLFFGGLHVHNYWIKISDVGGLARSRRGGLSIQCV